MQASPGTARDSSRPNGLRPVKALLHAVDVLEGLADARQPLGVSQLARRLGLSKTAVYNILNTLETRRLVMKHQSDATYTLGWRLFELGSMLVRQQGVAQKARAHLEPLAEVTGETVLLGVLDDFEVLYLDSAHSERAIQMVAGIGRRSPLHSIASGKILLAYQPDQFVEAYIDRGLPSFTHATVTSGEVLREHIREVRRMGYATCLEEHEASLCSLSVAIRDYSGSCVAALTLAGPSARFNSETFDAALPHLCRSASQIEAELGRVADDVAGQRRT
jgi:DNA-binding IclR family transcriptional regulator